MARVPDIFPRNGKFDSNLRRLTFSVEAGREDSERDLVLRQNPILMDLDADEQQVPLVLARNVKDFVVECWDTNALDWVTEWDTTNSLPPHGARHAHARLATRIDLYNAAAPATRRSRAKSPCLPAPCPPSPRPARRWAGPEPADRQSIRADGQSGNQPGAKSNGNNPDLESGGFAVQPPARGNQPGFGAVTKPAMKKTHRQNSVRHGAHRGDDCHRGVFGAGGGAGVFHEGGDQARDERRATSSSCSGSAVPAWNMRAGSWRRRRPPAEPYDSLNQIWAGGPGGPMAKPTARWRESPWTIFKIGDGTVSLKIIDLERKANINTAPPAVLQQALTVMGVDADDISVVSDSIQDWRSPPAPPRVAGAESDYYQSLTPPYNAKNAPIDDMSELLFVKGVTPEMYDPQTYGGSSPNSPAPQRPKLGFGVAPGQAPDYPFGLEDVFTAVSSGKININTADANVLQLIPGMDANSPPPSSSSAPDRTAWTARRTTRHSRTPPPPCKSPG